MLYQSSTVTGWRIPASHTSHISTSNLAFFTELEKAPTLACSTNGLKVLVPPGLMPVKISPTRTMRGAIYHEVDRRQILLFLPSNCKSRVDINTPIKNLFRVTSRYQEEVECTAYPRKIDKIDFCLIPFVFHSIDILLHTKGSNRTTARK